MIHLLIELLVCIIVRIHAPKKSRQSYILFFQWELNL